MIKIFKDSEKLARKIVDEFIRMAMTHAKAKKELHFVLSGGRTPKRFFEKLAIASKTLALDWLPVHFWWGDERCVPADSDESNFGMTQRLLLNQIDIPASNVHPIFGKNNPPDEVVRFDQEIQDNLPLNSAGLPVFDWILLGMGTDGHTASIFPGQLLSPKATFCGVARHPQTGQKRISLTIDVINAAKRVSFLITGHEKADLVRGIISGEKAYRQLPAAQILPAAGKLEWYLDAAAASQLH